MEEAGAQGTLAAEGSSSGMNDQAIGLTLAISSSLFIGASFIVKKRGLRIAGSSGLRAGMGGFSYLKEPIWWGGMMAMVLGEAANFAAYAFAPAILVTPLGALSIIISAILAHLMLNERLNVFGMLGCALCITGSITIVLHAPPERPLHSVVEVWQLAMQPAFIGYTVFAVSVIVFLIWGVAPTHGTTNIFVYLAICSLAGSLSVMSCKALGIALKLTFQGDNQLVFFETHFCLAVVVCCVITQMNYLNKALDIFNTAIVSPVYYVMFTVFTIVASIIMFRDIQSPVQIATEACGFLTIVAGTFLLHATRDLDVSSADLARLALASGTSGPGTRLVHSSSIGGAGGAGNGSVSGLTGLGGDSSGGGAVPGHSGILLGSVAGGRGPHLRDVGGSSGSYMSVPVSEIDGGSQVAGSVGSKGPRQAQSAGSNWFR